MDFSSSEVETIANGAYFFDRAIEKSLPTFFGRFVNLQISIFGLIIIATIYAACGAVLLAVWRRVVDRTWGRVVVYFLGLTVLLSPWVDEVWIAWNFNKFCKEAGVRVVRQVMVEGYFDDTVLGTSKPGPIVNPQAIDRLNRMGYRFVELRSINGQIARLERVDGHWQQRNSEIPTARYHYKRIFDYRDGRGIHHESPVAYKVDMTGEVVMDAKTGTKIGERVIYKRSPGWVDGLWIELIGNGLTLCPDPEKGPQERGLRESVLVPTKSP